MDFVLVAEIAVGVLIADLTRLFGTAYVVSRRYKKAKAVHDGMRERLSQMEHEYVQQQQAGLISQQTASEAASEAASKAVTEA